jgi:hypothetical protein
MTTDTTVDTGTSELLCVIRDRVAVITLNRPEARNSLSDTLTRRCARMIRTCAEDPNVGALHDHRAGEAFCAGGNVKGMGAHRDPEDAEMPAGGSHHRLQERSGLLTGALVSVRKPTIAALPGGGRRGACHRHGLRHPHRRAIGLRRHRLCPHRAESATTASPGCSPASSAPRGRAS